MVTKDVPEGVTVVGIPARTVQTRSAPGAGGFSPYGTPLGDLPDPVIRAIDGLMGELTQLQGRVVELEKRLADQEAGLAPGCFEEGDERAGSRREPGSG